MSKLKSSDFEEFIDDFDLICLTESKLDNFDTVNIPGYTCFQKNRKIFKHKSGGVALLVKDKYKNKVKILEGTCNSVLWFSLKVGCTNNECLFGIVYIPPEGSCYSDVTIFDEIEHDLTSLRNAVTYVCLFGDFNSRTKNNPDYVQLDDIVMENVGLEQNIRQDLLNENVLEELGFTLQRYSQDDKLNNYGNLLLSLCKNNELYIVNGRVGKDRNIGRLTCKNSSVVDYMLCSPELFSQIHDFEVKEFRMEFSDAHCPISVSICMENEGDPEHMEETASDTVKMPIKARWLENNKQNFINNLSENDIEEVNTEMEGILTNIKETSLESVEQLVEKVNNILLKSANESGMIKKIQPKKKDKKKSCKPWFNENCIEKRREFFTAKKRYHQNKTIERQNDLKRASKAYKKELNKQYRIYHKNLHHKLRTLKSSNSKTYWKILNGGSESREEIRNLNLELFTDHFKSLNSNQDDEDFNIDYENINENNTILNRSFTEEEVLTSIKSLKNNKACGEDNILNEFLKAAASKLLSTYTKLFNIILESGMVPSMWEIGIIKPIFKNKGDPADPDNYRGITILSCFSKLLTSVVNNRLTEFLEDSGALNENQAGFRKGYSTMDHIFTLKSLIDIYLNKNKRIYAAFVDYRKAFDCVSRPALWVKILNHNIDGKVFKLIKNLYDNAKSCVKLNNCISDLFRSCIGVRQGENLSPLLFALFLNDLELYLSEMYKGLPTVSDMIYEHLETEDTVVYIKLFALLYADDTILLAESKEELQKCLNSMHNYCNLWKLNVNETKTKVLVFSKGKIRNIPRFYYGDKELDVVFEYTYLGVTMNYNGKFVMAKKRLYDQANKAMFSLLRKARSLLLPVDLQLELFHTLVTPIVLYGSEIWGYENLELIEKLHLRFCRILLNVNKSTPLSMLYGELGETPLALKIKHRTIAYWLRIVTGKEDKLSAIMYKLMFRLDCQNIFKSQWISNVKNILNESGLSYVWLDQENITNGDWIKEKLKENLHDQYEQTWSTNVYNSSKCLTYRIIKTKLQLEKYLIDLSPNVAKPLCKFRTSNHKLPIEKGRYYNIERKDRLCLKCNLDVVGDEFHYLFVCPFFKDDRKKFIKPYYVNRPNVYKLEQLFNSKNSELRKLSQFVKTVMSQIN